MSDPKPHRGLSGLSWRVVLPPGWRSEPNEACHAAVPDHGVGALQFSSARKGDQAVTEADLLEFAQDDLEGRQSGEVTSGDFTGITVEFTSEGVYWRKWWLRNGSVLLFVTYNCVAGEEGSEATAIDMILGSLRELHDKSELH